MGVSRQREGELLVAWNDDFRASSANRIASGRSQELNVSNPSPQGLMSGLYNPDCEVPSLPTHYEMRGASKTEGLILAGVCEDLAPFGQVPLAAMPGEWCDPALLPGHRCCRVGWSL